MLNRLKPFHNSGNEIIIVDDGSDDNTFQILSKCNFIKIIHNSTNQGKGFSLKVGILNATKDGIVIFDGDLELDPSQIRNLMILDYDKNIKCVFASRYKDLSMPKSLWDFGNFTFTKLFNFLHGCEIKDALCCAKSFYRNQLNPKSLKSKKFDIDIEIASKLIINHNITHTVYLDYYRRGKNDGKKLKLIDSFSILSRLLNSTS